MASINGHVEVTKFLIDKGANISVINKYAIQNSILHDNVEIIKFLKEKGVLS